jgi:hypothetical protein
MNWQLVKDFSKYWVGKPLSALLENNRRFEVVRLIK